jgi:hypothetical protein
MLNGKTKTLHVLVFSSDIIFRNTPLVRGVELPINKPNQKRKTQNQTKSKKKNTQQNQIKKKNTQPNLNKKKKHTTKPNQKKKTHNQT